MPVATLLLVAGGAVVAALACARCGVGRAAAPSPPLPGGYPVRCRSSSSCSSSRCRCRCWGWHAGQLTHRDSYTLASDALATLRGDPCGLQRSLLVETDPAAGVLPAR